MCGICGQFNYGRQAPVLLREVQQMARSIIHRGPDDEGYYVNDRIGLGFRRLSIIDIEGGHQPMSDAEETVRVVFNGEIYNFPELRRELESFGHVFRTRSDTEVIVLGYKQWGDDVLNHLNGMFGLAIWDERKRRLLIARDPFGIKPIYYKIKDGSVWFGSEIRTILATAKDNPEPDPTALNLFLRYRFTPSPYTVFKGISKLAAGTMLIFEDGKSSQRRWYRNNPHPFSPMKSEAEAREELLEIYKRSVKRHLLSDVPVGLLLSGGIDSSLLLALMNLYGKSWRTFTVGYGKTFADDELSDAAQTAAEFNAMHTEVLLDRKTFEDSLPRVVEFMEEPVATPSVLPMFFVCERARRDVKVALIGQGPDELFGGYRRHLGTRYGQIWGTMPKWVRGPISSMVEALPRNETLKRGVRSLDTPDRLRRYQQVLSLLPDGQIDGLFKSNILPPAPGDEILKSWGDFSDLMDHTDELGGLQFIEMRSTLPDELLMYGDKLSMAHSLEVRVPYLDKEVVEFGERLSAGFKVRNGVGKWIHREVCKSFLPASIMRRKKRGFAMNVVDEWFRAEQSKKMEGMLLDPQSHIFDYLQSAAVRALLDQHRSGASDHHKILFSLVVLEEWLRGSVVPAV
ncbi:asparagine synthase (glutamine-hydrolyzing) [Terracidiphilus gabretensis]|jgi:asparagine synthase (glutamine-hydrolysing)|uniref:asparagine synthase (glutamine-hydrolyzing) n=1 Tax=Terracidiphilus gabretensis TaxID=1577687 RepID=UPI00071BD7FA|nr:asparagine synthase (glutamine-hydrolyzing) [Terracidiphilus gabretensis]